MDSEGAGRISCRLRKWKERERSGEKRMSQRKASATGAAKPPRKKIRWKRMLPFYLMALPGFIYMIINNYLPMFGIVIAFKKLNFKKGIWGSPWCGFDNFKFLFASADAWIITRNTIFYNIAFFLGRKRRQPSLWHPD